MVRLLKFLLSLGCLAAFVWWGLTVPLGDRSLFGHIRAIGKSEESQELVRGTKEKMADLTRKLSAAPQDGTDAQSGSAPAPAQGGEITAQAENAPPQEHLSDADRKQMRKLIDSARAKASQ